MNATTENSEFDAITQASKAEITPSWHDNLPDPRAAWIVMRRNIWPFLIAALLFVAGVAIWVYLQTPIYAATSSLVVQPRGETVIDIKSVAPDLSPTTDIVDTEVRLVSSPAIALRVADAFAARYPTSKPKNEQARVALANNLAATMQAARVGSTYVIEITSRATHAQQAAEIASLFATEFVAANREAKSAANSNASGWLRSKVSELERAATTAEAALQQYKIGHNLVSSNGATLAEEQLSTLSQEIATAEANLAEKEGRLSAARNQLTRGGGGADVGAALGSGTIGTLRAREAQQSTELAQLQAQYGELYPPVQTARQGLSDVRRQIQLEINRILSNLEADTRVAASRLSSLRASQGQSAGALAANSAAAVGLSELQRRADAANAVYQTFLNRLRETSAQEGLQQADLRVAQLAQTPLFPESPRTNVALTFALIGGLISGLLAVGISEYLSGGVRSKTDVEKRLRIRYVGAVPTLQSTLDNIRAVEAPHDYVVSHPLSIFAESFRSLRAFLLLGNGVAAGTPRILAITSALPQEGKTTTAVCLARTSAMGGISTILVDCDLRRRGSSELLGYGEGPDLYAYLSGTATLDEAVRKDSQTGLTVLGTASTAADMPDPLNIENVRRLLTELRQRYQVVVLDTAPTLGVADARIVASNADRVLMITRWQHTSLRACETAIDMLLDAGAKITGMALTQVDIKKYSVTGHADAYGYQKKFKGYYAN